MPHRKLYLTLIVAMMAALLVVMVLTLQQRKHQEESDARQVAQQNCEADFQQRLVATLHGRSDATRAAILAPQKFFEVLAPLLTARNQTPEQQAQALADLIAANKAASDAYSAYVQSQEDNPLPPLPNQFCGSQGSNGGNR